MTLPYCLMQADPEKVLQELSKSHSPKGFKCEGLKGKSPDEVKQLAHHYYRRARHAESREKLATDALREAVAEIKRLRGLAHEMTEGGDA